MRPPLARLLLALAAATSPALAASLARAELPGTVVAEPSAVSDSSQRVAVSVIPSWGGRPVAPGADLIAAVVFDHDEKWHVHTHDPDVPPELGSADNYIATEIDARTSDNAPLTAHSGEAIQWPEASVIEVAFAGEPVDYAVYAGRAVAYVPITVAPDAEPGEYEVRFELTYQACDDKVCLRPVMGQTVTVGVEVVPFEEAAAAAPLPPDRAEALQAEFAGFDASVWPALRRGDLDAEPTASRAASTGPSQVVVLPFVGNFDFSHLPPWLYGLLMLGVAFVGGAVLNLTPCVLPVLPLKVMALQNAAQTRARTLGLGLVMAGGLLGFWLAIGLLLVGLRQFNAVNQLFQYAWFTIGVGVFIAVMGVGMLGVFTVQLPRWVYAVNPTQETVTGSLLYGVMTAILATPCAGPFMGFAIAWATQVSPLLTLGIFVLVGLGMAAPYLVLAAFPQLTQKIPRTGPGSELLKQVMGLLMLAAAAFFLGSGLNAATTDGTAAGWSAYWWVVGGLVAAAGLWLAYRALRLSLRTPTRLATVAVGLVFVLSGYGIASIFAMGDARSNTANGGTGSVIDWTYYSPEAFQAELDAGRVVVMDFTADWCINCKVLEKTVLEDQAVASLLDDPGVTPMKVDITSSANEAGNAKLAEMGYSTIPLLVVFDPQGQAVFKNDFYRVQQVVDAITAARGSHAPAEEPAG